MAQPCPLPPQAYKLWHKRTLAQPEGMRRSAELVVALCRTDATGQFMERVFGTGDGAWRWAGGQSCLLLF